MARRIWGVEAVAIPLKKGGKRLMHSIPLDPRCRLCLPARSVIVVVSSPYDGALRELRATIARRIGILAEGEVTENDKGIFAEREEMLLPGSPFRVHTLGKGFRQFRAIGLSVEHPTEYQLRSQRYNQVVKLSGFSELRVRMANGRALFGSDSSLVEIRRIDYTKQHPRYYDIPLPWKESMEDDLVTDTEIDLIRETTVRLGNVKARYFVPYPGHREGQYWQQFMTEIKTAAQDP